ncbi:hypothetical protein [Pseudoalteromonas phenolica]|uniref:GRAM domain-containing protein n=1 Tax=Pseudoalteromonas phenolica TaxID=161398 RepID=A0A0S2K0S1_9GAMM|nr:hypothetical protein [Pseudoalteromonas phenolica]ALO41736.1 hypothetical protein PP2015_1220 [Pseudoalteromonas phenolica]MBE0353711.1 hypothetical protein [Pseudoalteromonas phenolica O-BC30]RXE95011.1 hypothetical protein D9981_17030 [Pseudoalteromonas phenolica O-BC30]
MTAPLTSHATIQIGAMRSDGQLSLNEQGLSFKPASKSLSLGVLKIALSEVSQVELCLAKGAGFMPISEQAMRVTLNTGKQYEFVLAEQESWVIAINNLLN